MRRLSIRVRVTLWYTVFMVGIVAVMLTVLVELSGNVFLSNKKDTLVQAVEEAVEEIAEDDEETEYFEDGVYLLHYNEKQEFIEGSIPKGFEVTTALTDGTINTVTTDGQEFYVYDRQMSKENGETIWIRGVLSYTSASQVNRILIGMACIFLPILVLISSIIGYLITKKAFEPVRKIQKTAQSITKSKELSTRIGLPKGNDEISELGRTVDEMLDQLEMSFEKEKQFTSDASHELRTPLSVVLTESEYMLQHVDTLEEARESMEVVNRQASKMSVLINQLLFFARAEADAITLAKESADIKEIVEEIIEDLAGKAGESEIAIHFNEKMPHIPYSVNKMLFIRAVQNVIYNAIVYGKQGGHIQVSLKEEKQYFIVEVADDGIGISKENLEKIWNRFYRVDAARTSEDAGSTGLGLSMVKWIVEKHGGYVKAESTLGKGSVFSLYFPIT